jgi:dimethylargininase
MREEGKLRTSVSCYGPACHSERSESRPERSEGNRTAWLHLKTGLSWLGGRRLLAAGGIAGHEALRGWEVVEVPKAEEYAANCIRVNDAVLVAQGFPETAALVRGLGHDVAAIDMSEYRKMDGGLSCLSVRW